MELNVSIAVMTEFHLNWVIANANRMRNGYALTLLHELDKKQTTHNTDMRTGSQSKDREKDGVSERASEFAYVIECVYLNASNCGLLFFRLWLLLFCVHKASVHDTINTLSANRKGKYMAECKRNRNIVTRIGATPHPIISQAKHQMPFEFEFGEPNRTKPNRSDPMRYRIRTSIMYVCCYKQTIG